MSVPPIVLIDDDQAWSEATADYLRSEGFQVVTAADGEQGLQLLLDQRPQLAILDAHLPRLGGLEVLRELRRAQLLVQVLMVSADDRSPLINQAMEEGAVGFLRKPVAASMLLRAVRRLVHDGTASQNPIAGPS